MMREEHWRRLIAAAKKTPPTVIRADAFVRRHGDSQGPAELMCEDGESYVVKDKHAGRVVVNDHVSALLGKAMGAPIPAVRLVDVPEALVRLHDQLREFTPGLAHGSRRVPGCYDVKGSPEQLFRYAKEPQNRHRFARLAVLYGWLEAQDRQWLYEEAPPHFMHSVDHGHFFRSGEKWSEDTFDPGRGTRPDWFIERYAELTPAEIKAAAALLARIDDARIADIIAAPPDEWELAEEHRVEMAAYAATRRDAMIDYIRAHS
jgi:hypothetical protein